MNPADAEALAPSGGPCPYCGRIMSKRERAEQGACNECFEPNPASDGKP